ncbi:MAG: pteridine reductase [Legionellaceae bacterium]|nr:pteridine reductase [Legionellaceae bacterium]
MNPEKTQEKGVALVTGAARRIGAVIAKSLHEVGYDVVIHCRQSRHEADVLAKHLNAKRADSACVRMADLCMQSEAEALVKAAYAWKKRLDLLVNNASQFIKTPIQGFDERISDILWGIHVKAPFWLSQAAYPFLTQSGDGNIVNITDIHAEKPRRDYAVYTQTKAALNMQSMSLAYEYAPNVRVNVVAPGPILLPEGENALSAEMQAAEIASHIPLKRWGEPKWVAEAVLAFASNSYITGQMMRVDGGRSLS